MSRLRAIAFGSTPWTVRTISVLLVCFYLAASARTLIPGICETFAAGLRACENPVVAQADSDEAECCTRTPALPGDRSIDGETSSMPRCALCNLTQSPAQPVTIACVAPSPQNADDTLPHLTEDVSPNHFWTPATRRGPPASPVQHS